MEPLGTIDFTKPQLREWMKPMALLYRRHSRRAGHTATTDATCSYSAASGAITINTLCITPAGTYTLTVVFTETEPGVAAAAALLPILLLPFARARRKISSWRLCFTLMLGVLLLVPAACVTACGGSSGSTQTPPTVTQQVASSATVRLTVQLSSFDMIG
jgi:hypothetical protein